MPQKIQPHIYITKLSRDSDLQARCGLLTLILTHSRSEKASKLPARFAEEPLFSIRREELGEHLGSLDEERWRVLVKALGNMMGSDCEPA
jgi:hypothetical protein